MISSVSDGVLGEYQELRDIQRVRLFDRSDIQMIHTNICRYTWRYKLPNKERGRQRDREIAR